MIVYQTTKSSFLDDAFTRDIEDVVLASFRARTGHAVGAAEIRSWKESLLAMAKVLNDDAIPADAGVAVEYGIPQSAKRIDFIVAGQDEARRDQFVIVELKQWESARRTHKDGIVVTRFAHGEAEVSHPSYQAWSYASLLRNFNETVYESALDLRPCAYLHNYAGDGALTDPFYADYLARAPLFLRGEDERARLRDFIRAHVRHGDRGHVIERVEQGRIRPSKGLADSLVGLLAGNPEFVLIDDQKVVYETALDLARRAADGGAKQVVVVEGGPGTGKSVVAINLLVALTQGRLFAKYVTRNAAPRAVFEKKLTGTRKKTDISNLFSNSGAFIDTGRDAFSALLVDEAHRLSEKSGLYGNLGHHQVEELIGSARCAIFFIDEDQRVTWKDVGERRDIERRARRLGAQVTHLKLASQFRCGGSDGYLGWLDHTLQVRETANPTLDPAEFDFQVFDSPETLRRVIEEKNRAANRARMVAGYCWDWKGKKDASVIDVRIPEYDFGMRWNLSEDGGLWITGGGLGEGDRLHPHLPGAGSGLHRRDRRAGPGGAGRPRDHARPEKRSKQDQSIKGYKKLLATEPQAAPARAPTRSSRTRTARS